LLQKGRRKIPNLIIKKFMKLKSKLLIFTLAMVFALGTALPAKAFYIEVPQILKDAISALKSSQTMAQEGTMMAPPLNGNIFCNSLGRQSTPEECNTADRAQGSNFQGQPQPTNSSSGGCVQPAGGCGSNLTWDPSICSCRTFNDDMQKMPEQQYRPQQNNNQPMMNEPQQNNKPMMNDKQGGGDNNRYLQDMQRGAKQMDRSLKQFDDLLQTTEKAGGTVKAEIKAQAEKLRAMLEKIKTAKSSEELQDFDMGEANQIAQELEQYRREVQEQTQRLKQVKQQIRNAEQAVKSFEKQITKAKDCVSTDVKTKLETLKTTITTVKNAKTWDEVEAAGLDDMGDLFDDVNSSREQLEICSRWPQILKQVDKQLKDLSKQLTKNKTLVAKLSAKGIDLSVAYNAFESGVTKMKTAREEAVAKMQSGDAQGAIDMLQDDIFDQMEDVMLNQQTIQIMSNLGTFNSQFKRGLTDAQKQINSLKKKKIDTTELVAILDETKTKGAEILALIKRPGDDQETIMTGMEDLQDLRMEFSDKVAELTGDEVSTMPAMTGQQQFNQLQMASGLNQYMNQTPGGKQGISNEPVYNPMGESNPQPSPSPMNTLAPGTY